ncbi:MAG TPA: OB-fold nucleic acid binding domain-containing protein, partial [Nocardioides sp.]
SLTDVKGISEAEVARIVEARGGGAYVSLSDFFHRARVSRPVLERLVLAGAFDSLYRIGDRPDDDVGPRGRVTRRDLLLQVAELDRHARALDRATRARGLAGQRSRSRTPVAQTRADEAARRNSSDPRDRAAVQARSARQPRPVDSVQLTLSLGDEPGEGGEAVGLPEMTPEERMRAELDILGLDASRHVMTRYASFLESLGVTASRDLLARRSRSELLVAGVKVATQTPPIRSGHRVVFLTVDDGTGPVDATFFEDVQGPCAATVFSSWLLLVRGELRRTGRRGVSLRATGAWELSALHDLWRAAPTAEEGAAAVRAELERVPGGAGRPAPDAGPEPGRRRVLVHSSGFRMSPYSDVRPAGDDTREVARKLWHRSPGSPG